MAYVTVVTRNKGGMVLTRLADRVRDLMEARGLTPYALAKAAGVDATYVYRILKGQGKRPSHATLTRLAGVLGVTVEELTGVDLPPVRVVPGTVDMPGPLLRVMERLGQYINDRDWEVVAGILEDRASERAALRARIEALEAHEVVSTPEASPGDEVPEEAEEKEEARAQQTA